MSAQWHDAYKIGHEKIDQQHQRRFELTSALAEADGLPALRKALMQLYKHTREHFELEESFMRELNYPAANAHIAAHDQLLTRLNAVSLEVGQGQIDRVAIERLIVEWALRHIPNEDTQLTAYVALRQATK